MKRILFVLLTTILFLSLCSSASAAQYTHPTAGFQLTIPEGWVAIDSTNAEEIINSSRLNAGLTANIASMRGLLDSTHSVYLFKEDVARPPFINVGIEYKAELDEAVTLEDVLKNAQAYEAYYLNDHEKYPGYTVSNPAGAEQVGDYLMGHLSGVYEISGHRIALAVVSVADSTRWYDFVLIGEEDQVSDAISDFGEMVASFAAPGSGAAAVGTQTDTTATVDSAKITMSPSQWEANFQNLLAYAVENDLPLAENTVFSVADFLASDGRTCYKHSLELADFMMVDYFEYGDDVFHSATLTISLDHGDVPVEMAQMALFFTVLAGDTDTTWEEFNALMAELSPAFDEVFSGEESLNGVQLATLRGITYGIDASDSEPLLWFYTNLSLASNGA